ncbi:MAG TPA: EAL domain-containing protein, partial [Burkholderiaceae bacterium]|nr:EAL domain-containing protein [Burkholderiaceae bacterium]
ALARRLIEMVDGPMRVGEFDLRMMATIGVARLPEDGSKPEVLLGCAQAAMRFARDNGTRLYQFYSASIGQSATRRLRLESELRGAIDRDEFTVHYQLRCKLRGGRRIVGVEALLRWNHPERGTVAAGEFIAVAEETGLISLIGESVLRKACADAAHWPQNVGLSVNLSTREFRGNHLEGIIDRALAESGLHPNRLLVELTEASLQRDFDRTDVALARLAALRERGVRVVLDNFGIGPCNLDLLRRCRAEYIKISAQLIHALDADDVFVMVRAISALSRQFGATVIAEGIEDSSQVSAALRAGCTEGQGFHLGRPLTAEKMSELIRVRRVRSTICGAAGSKKSAG